MGIPFTPVFPRLPSFVGFREVTPVSCKFCSVYQISWGFPSHTNTTTDILNSPQSPTVRGESIGLGEPASRQKQEGIREGEEDV